MKYLFIVLICILGILLINQQELQESLYSPATVEIPTVYVNKTTIGIATTVGMVLDSSIGTVTSGTWSTPSYGIIGQVDLPKIAGTKGTDDCLDNLKKHFPNGFILVMEDGELEWRKK